MILPTKHIPPDKALLTIGSHILKKLDRKKTVSALWEDILTDNANDRTNVPDISYDWFVLALDMLYTIDAIEIYEGLLNRKTSHDL